MKSKLFVTSCVSVIILIIGIVVYLIFSFNKGTASTVVKNNASESTNSKVEVNVRSKIKSISPLTYEDFVIKDKRNYIELGGKYGDLKTNEKIVKTVPGNEKHIYDIYEFDNFKVLTQIGGGASSIIWSVDLTTPIIQTSRGISVGDTVSEVIEKYGKPESASTADSVAPGQYVYRDKGEYLTFFIDKNGKVVLIRFELT